MERIWRQNKDDLKLHFVRGEGDVGLFTVHDRVLKVRYRGTVRYEKGSSSEGERETEKPRSGVKITHLLGIPKNQMTFLQI